MSTAPTLALTLTLLGSIAAMSAIVAVRYLVTSGAFAWWTHRRFPGRMAGRRAQIGREIRWSMASALVFGLPAGIVGWGWERFGWTRIYTQLDAYPLWMLPLSFVSYLVIHDAWFYWTHRWMHRPKVFAAVHSVHHASRPPTAFAAMSFHWWEAWTGAIVIPLLVFLIPIHVGVLGAVLAVMTLMGITNHMGWEMFPRALVHGPLGKWVITASHHEGHHQRYRGNYGLYFRFWDRLCGTDLGLHDWSAAVAAAGARGGHSGSDRRDGAAQREGAAARLPDREPQELSELRG